MLVKAQHTHSELHSGLKTSTVSKDYGCCEECCSLEGFIKGIIFYGGFAGIHAMMDVCLSREPSNQYNRNAVLVSQVQS